MRSLATTLLLMLFITPAVYCNEALVEVELTVRVGVDKAGVASEDWLSILRRRLSPDEYARVTDIRRPMTEEELEWELLIRSRRPAWQALLPAIAAHYHPASQPNKVVIVLGNRGASDAFTHSPTMIGFDLAVLQRAYGSARSEENTERIDRLFSHEYAHLMQKSWMRDHPYPTDNPFRAALRGIWLEGLGHYHSMSSRWRASNGESSSKSLTTLQDLEPRFCARLAALACATDANAERLTADLSEGRFDRKWGALTVALWLEREMSASPDAYHRLVEEGPGGVLEMARRHLPDELRVVIDEVARAEELCGE